MMRSLAIIERDGNGLRLEHFVCRLEPGFPAQDNAEGCQAVVARIAEIAGQTFGHDAIWPNALDRHASAGENADTTGQTRPGAAAGNLRHPLSTEAASR